MSLKGELLDMFGEKKINDKLLVEGATHLTGAVSYLGFEIKRESDILCVTSFIHAAPLSVEKICLKTPYALAILIESAPRPPTLGRDRDRGAQAITGPFLYVTLHVFTLTKGQSCGG